MRLYSIVILISIGSLIFGNNLTAQSVELIGIATIQGDATDHSGQTEPMDDGTPNNCYGGISGLDYHADTNTFIALSDRGARDGEVHWQCRYHTVKLDISNDSIKPTIESTVMLKDKEKRPFVGLATQYDSCNDFAARFDPEGVRTLPNGNLLISDEYGPQIIEFTTDGKEVRRIPVPEKLLIRNLGPDKATENNRNSSGRACNRGMEGIALTPDGKYLVCLMQSPLLQDAIRIEEGKPLGFHSRIVKIELETGLHEEFVYVMDNPKHKLHEILPINNNEFLVLENCGEENEAATFKKVIRIDIREATDVSQMAQLPALNLSEFTKPVAKSVFLDMLDPRFGLANTIPEKIEGLAFGPTVKGQTTLVIATDNDFVLENPSKMYVFRFQPFQTADNR